ncbi:unnamed protein product [Rotaria socialis]|uniref:N-acetylgalactosaminide beta-1,3-galactosyltransferase n=2 Tax=Rotaria socialis TaxID=392032 RepID=A0A817PH99_9BILA|nr:unnamed protein product [Rotaria socialis]
MMPSLPNCFSNLSSTFTLQLLSGIIFLFCTLYLVFSIHHPFTFNKIIVGIDFKRWQTNGNTNNDITKLLTGNETNVKIHSSNLSSESFICDYDKNNDTHQQTNIEFKNHRLNALRPYCDIVPTPRNTWISAKQHVESDIVFIIYTGASFYQNRAIAIRDSWLSRVTHKYFFSSIPYSPLPITVIEGAGENYMSNMKKLYQGMQIAYQKHKETAKFYFLAGCDTFVNVPHLLKRLDYFNHTEALVIGGNPFEYSCYRQKNQVVQTISYPSGGAGFFLSAAMMEMMYPKLDSFFQNHWPTEKVPYSDVALNCLAYSLGVRPSFVPGFWAFTPEQTLKDQGRLKLHADPEPNTFHYVPPKSMYILDEFYVFQHVDRLANDNNLNELVKFTRQFVAAHYELLRIKTAECTLPPVKST